jgi:lysophospholipase L1-like esterase
MQGARRGDRARLPARARVLLAPGVLALASFAATLATAEAVFRSRLATNDVPAAADEAWRQRYRHLNATLYRPSADPRLVYQPVPSSMVEMEYGHAAFNAAGMRDDREFPRSPGERVRVVMLGDSLAWSEFVSLSDSLARRTEEALGAGFEVLNFGVTGYDTDQEAAWYEMRAREFHPGIVVVVYCMNDMIIASGPFSLFATPGERAEKESQDAMFERVAPLRRETLDATLVRRENGAPIQLLAYALAWWERRKFTDHYVDEYLIAAEDPVRRDRLRAALARLGSAIRRDGAIPLLFISPVLESWDRYHWEHIHAFVRAAGVAAGFEVHDPLAAWRLRYDPADLRIDNLHYGETGNRVFGATIGAAIRDALR